MCIKIVKEKCLLDYKCKTNSVVPGEVVCA